MIERTTEQRMIEDHRGGMWHTIGIRPARIPLFCRWAAHLGLSTADLAARIFTEGTLQLALDDLGGTVALVRDEERDDLVEAMLADLERHLAEAEARQGGCDAPDHS